MSREQAGAEHAGTELVRTLGCPGFSSPTTAKDSAGVMIPVQAGTELVTTLGCPGFSSATTAKDSAGVMIPVQAGTELGPADARVARHDMRED